MDEEIYFFCQHCNGLIESYTEARNHKCFRGKEHIYQNEDDTILFVENDENEKEKLKRELLEKLSNNSVVSGSTANIECDEDLNRSADLKAESNAKQNAVWTKKATIAMLNLYKANIQILIDIGKKSHVWQKISESLKDSCIQVTADQVKWKFNRLYNKYKECIKNNKKSESEHMTFEYYEQFEQIFHKEKNNSTPRTFSSSIQKKRKHDIIESKNISESKKIKIDDTSSENNQSSDDESPKLETTPVVVVKKTTRNQQQIQTMERQNIEENQKDRDEKIAIYFKMKENELELKKKAIDVRETEIQLKRDVASEKLKFNENKHKDWLTIEKLKCELLEKLLNNSLSSDEKKRKHDTTGLKTITKSEIFKIVATSSKTNLPPVDESPKLITTPVADVKKTASNQQRIQTMGIVQNIQENQKGRDRNMIKYLKMKDKEMELKKKAIHVRETEMQVKRDLASEKLKFNEKKHKDWLNIEKLKCELLEKLLKYQADSEESD